MGCFSDANSPKCPKCNFQSMAKDCLVVSVTMPAVMLSRAGRLRLMTILSLTFGCISRHGGRPMMMICLPESITILASMAVVPLGDSYKQFLKAAQLAKSAGHGP